MEGSSKDCQGEKQARCQSFYTLQPFVRILHYVAELNCIPCNFPKIGMAISSSRPQMPSTPRSDVNTSRSLHMVLSEKFGKFHRTAYYHPYNKNFHGNRNIWKLSYNYKSEKQTIELSHPRTIPATLHSSPTSL